MWEEVFNCHPTSHLFAALCITVLISMSKWLKQLSNFSCIYWPFGCLTLWKSLLKPFAQYLLGYMAICMDIHVDIFPFDYSSSLYFRVKVSISFYKSIYSPMGALWGLNILILMSSFIILFNMCLYFFVLFNKSLPTQDHNNIQWSSQDIYDFSFIIRSAVHLELMFEWLRINIIGFHSAQ